MSQPVPPAGPQFQAPPGYVGSPPSPSPSPSPNSQLGYPPPAAPFGPAYGLPLPWTPGVQHPPVLARPLAIGLAIVLAVTGAVQWLCGVTLLWMVAVAFAGDIDTYGLDGVIFHALNRFHFRMLDGLVWPVYLIPLATLVFALAMLRRQRWARLGYTAVGVAALVLSAVWLQGAPVLWLPVAAYIGLAVGLVWTAASNRWFTYGR